MDVYHKILVSLLDAVNGRDSKAVNFKDLVKKEGFFGNYRDIFDRLSREGWIVEDSKADFVMISHWGIAEAKKARSKAAENAVPDTPKNISENGAKCLTVAKSFTDAIGIFAKDATKTNFEKAEEYFAELKKTFDLAKKDAV